jgi:hypothetical protein
MAAKSVVRYKDLLKRFNSSGGCGSVSGCVYILVDGSYHLQEPSGCTSPCFCPGNLSQTYMVLWHLMCPTAVKQPDAVNKKTTPCASADFVHVTDEELLAAVRTEIAAVSFWRRVSLGLTIGLILVLAALIYVLFLR